MVLPHKNRLDLLKYGYERGKCDKFIKPIVINQTTHTYTHTTPHHTNHRQNTVRIYSERTKYQKYSIYYIYRWIDSIFVILQYFFIFIYTVYTIRITTWTWDSWIGNWLYESVDFDWYVWSIPQITMKWKKKYLKLIPSKRCKNIFFLH